VQRWLFLCAFGIGSIAAAATEVELGCQRLRLVLDGRLSDSVVARAWASGNPRTEAPAALELRGCAGQLLDRLPLDAPLARLDPTPLHGAPAPSYLVSVDLTAEAGSYNGPLTTPIAVEHERLTIVSARTADGCLFPIRLAPTGKAAWRKIRGRKVDDLLSVSCQPSGPGFIVTYRRYHAARHGWQERARTESGLWESDSDFPASQRFP
jgi:hypothetical protein